MISFKEIEMLGFKSFADHTSIKFDGGITAIVGPNGCGKSNVSDAIRWVLGEQRSKSLRGKSMQDVIFAGTEKRKKLSYCEVSLVFDNTNKWFNVEYDEVKITRKLYRSGDSDYLINDKPCRLKDITNLLYDSGIGRDGYSIIGQGKVEEIISSKPEERRSIFEDAAGISKFKARKDESERRLLSTRDNIARLNDILSEVTRRLGPLKKQSENAKEYLTLRDKLKSLEVNSYIYNYDHSTVLKDEIAEKKKGLEENLKIRQNELDIYTIKYDQNMTEINKIDKTSSDLHDKILSLNIELEKRQGENNLLQERLRNLNEQKERIESDLKIASANYDNCFNNLNSSKAMREENLKVLNEIKLEAETLSNKYLEIIDELTENEEMAEENQKAMLNDLTALSDIKSNISALTAKKESIQENIKETEEKVISIEKAIEELSILLSNQEEEKNNLSKRKDIIENTISSNKLSLQQLQSERIRLSDKIFEIKTSISNDTNRKNILTNLQSDFEGYQYAVKRLLQDSKTDKKLSSSIMGVVGNIIEVPEKFQTAVEMALGGSIQNIVTKDEENAKILINYLKDARLGRATFLPISSVKQRTLLNRDFLNQKGCLGVASELISFDGVYKRVIDSLLGTTVIADNLDNAVEIAKRENYSFKIVTLDGDVLSPQGSMSGGSKKAKESSLLSKENEIKSLAINIENNTKTLHELEFKLDSINVEIKRITEIIDSNSGIIQSVSGELSASIERFNATNQKLEEQKQDLVHYSSNLQNSKLLIKEIENKLSSVDGLEENFSSKQIQANSSIKDRQGIYEKLKERRDTYNEKITALKIQIASLTEKATTIDNDIERLTYELSIYKENMDKLTLSLNSQKQMIDTMLTAKNTSETSVENKKINEDLKSYTEKLNSLNEHKNTILQEIRTLDEKKSLIMDDVTKLQNRIFQEDTKLQKVDIDLENMQEKIYEQYEMTYSDCLPFKKENFDNKEGMIEISKIKGQISNLGPINISAIEEYEQEGSRFEEMSTQMEDLQKSESDLMKIIQDLSSEMLTKFNTEFAKINENFTKVFKELFGGGNARLELLPSEDPLLAGVEIVAQPPGKNLQNITLMSGGEKAMTAIAILFAILRLRPMPFCLLDEIEAALDDANVDRYARYLQRFSEVTQFIVITHRKPTMELADNLYGVTMEEKGVSKVVSVQLSDAVKNSTEGKK